MKFKSGDKIKFKDNVSYISQNPELERILNEQGFVTIESINRCNHATYCDDCPGGNYGYKLVECDTGDAVWCFLDRDCDLVKHGILPPKQFKLK